MPSYIVNIIEASPKVINQFRKAPLKNIKGYNQATFYNIIPKAKFLDTHGFAIRARSLDMIPKMIESSSNKLNTINVMYNQIKFGDSSIYDYNLTNYGISGHPQNESFQHNRIKFETPWTHPTFIIEKLSTLFPEETIRVKYADQGSDSHCEEYDILNGETEYYPVEYPFKMTREIAGVSLKDIQYWNLSDSELENNGYTPKEIKYINSFK